MKSPEKPRNGVSGGCLSGPSVFSSSLFFLFAVFKFQGPKKGRISVVDLDQFGPKTVLGGHVLSRFGPFWGIFFLFVCLSFSRFFFFFFFRVFFLFICPVYFSLFSTLFCVFCFFCVSCFYRLRVEFSNCQKNMLWSERPHGWRGGTQPPNPNSIPGSRRGDGERRREGVNHPNLMFCIFLILCFRFFFVLCFFEKKHRF